LSTHGSGVIVDVTIVDESIEGGAAGCMSEGLSLWYDRLELTRCHEVVPLSFSSARETRLRNESLSAVLCGRNGLGS
jgi:hypothetical protein